MLKAARITIFKARKTILLFTFFNVAFYIAFLMLVKYTNLLHVTGLRTVNYLVLTLLALVQVNRLNKEFKGVLPFLEVMSVTFATGTLAFSLFSIFLFFYSFFDPFLNSLYIMDLEGMPRVVPPLLVFFEGSGISIIVGLITMIYSEKFSDKGTV